MPKTLLSCPRRLLLWREESHLTAAVVSNDVHFTHRVVGEQVGS